MLVPDNGGMSGLSMKIVLSDKASQDLLRFYAYFAEKNPQVAETILLTIDAKLQHLTRFPFLGRERSSLLIGLRGLVVGEQVIFYTASSDTITIIRVIDSRMDVDAEFQR